MLREAVERHFQTTFLPWRPFVTTTLGTIAMVMVSTWASPLGQVCILGLLWSLSIGLTWECLARLRDSPAGLGFLETPFFLSHDTQIFEHYRQIAQKLLTVSQRPDPIYRDVALARLAHLSEEIAVVAAGTLVYAGTETWRIAYEKLLRYPGLFLYRSVAWVQNQNYWQDEPGRQSMRLNFELHARGRLTIERIVILADELWPRDKPLPVERLRQWIHEQNSYGIGIKLVRQSAVEHEPGLVADIGIYGSLAVGTQELDDECRTARFVLTFDFDAVAEAEERWKRLSVYATDYRDLLEQFEIHE
ncbi:MAG: hypothetical protein HY000_13810 [Planctomycetes bacterium]|nr:hypothetical protein [Planctomycetota bacterium]